MMVSLTALCAVHDRAGAALPHAAVGGVRLPRHLARPAAGTLQSRLDGQRQRGCHGALTTTCSVLFL